MKKLRPDFEFKGKLYDSIILSKLIWPDLKDRDFRNQYKPAYRDMPKHLFGRHSLESWGWRLGDFKDDFKPGNYLDEDGKPHTWKSIGWTQDMEDYCVQDVVVLNKLCDLIDSKEYSPLAIELETDFAWLIKRQEMVGFAFDEEKAEKLLQDLLARRGELYDELQKFFPPWYASKGIQKPKKSRREQEEALGYDYNDPIYARGPVPPGKKLGPLLRDDDGNKIVSGYKYKKAEYTENAPFTRIHLTTFNPTSGDHTADRLMKVYGWRPNVFNEKDGKPSTKSEILETLDYECMPALLEAITIDKRLGQLSSGKQAWLKNVKDGRIYGKVDTLGAITGRCTHSNPNVAQVPASRAPYGERCRELFCAPPGYVIVGADASGLELRCLGHYMAAYDEGEYALEVTDGDVHWKNLLAIGIAKANRDKANECHEKARDAGKTWTYSYLYGGGVTLSGVNFIHAYKAYNDGKSPEGTIEQIGKKSRADLKKGLPALASLEKAVQQKARRHGVLKGLDGRSVVTRAVYSSLNTLLQGAGALIMKQALVELERLLQERGLKNSWQSDDFDYEYVANVHDEFQIQVKEEHAQTVGECCVLAMRRAGEFFNFRCRIDGEAKIGPNWSKTH